MEHLCDLFRRNRRQFQLCLGFTLLWGILAHGSAFSSAAFAHDALNEFNAELCGNDLRMAYGRIFVPAYRFLSRGPVALPWMIWTLSLLWLSAAVFLTSKSFGFTQPWKLLLLAGVYTTNLTVAATGSTYIHDLDCNMLALALACGAVWLWRRGRFLSAMIPVCLSIGLYQSYVSVAITMVLLLAILDLRAGKGLESVVAQGLRGAAMLLGGAVLYLLAIRLSAALSGAALATEGYNSISDVFQQSLLGLVRSAGFCYDRSLRLLLFPKALAPELLTYPIRWLLLGGTLVLVFRAKGMAPLEKLLAVTLVALLPYAMNFSAILSQGLSHDLMYFAFFLVPVLLLALLKQPGLLAGALAIALLLNVRTANGLYLKRELENQATLSLFTRIVQDMDRTPGYVAGETPVVFLGSPDDQLEPIPGFEQLEAVTGQHYRTSLGAADGEYYEAYFRYVLQQKLCIAEEDLWEQLQWSADDAAIYPAAGSIRMEEGVLLVRVGEKPNPYD